MTTVIAHTTDLSGDDGPAFVHAAALAAASGARLITVHGNAPADTASRLPDAAPLGVRWGRAIAHERRCHECCDDVTDTLLDALVRVMPGLVVTGTHARRGLSAVLHGSVSESLARNLAVPTLVVPNRGRGFVDEASGAVDLRRVLIPAGDAATAARGLAAARALLAVAGVERADLIVLVVGDHQLDLPLDGDVRVVHARGALDDAILASARDQQACLIVMPTLGHDGVGDVLFGSHTEHVIRAAGCPVLTVPVGSRAEG
jgi:nucleotide-binding universal stress UspA family protein